MKAKEIDNIIYEQLGSFFKEQENINFKVLKKRYGFSYKSKNNITFNLIFTNTDRGNYYDYKFSFGIYLHEIEVIGSKALDLELMDFIGYTQVLGLSYFTNNNSIFESQEWEILDENDIYLMLEHIKEFYYKYIVDFIRQNSSYEKILLLLEFIAKTVTNDSQRFERILILSKLLGIDGYQQKVEKYQKILENNNNVGLGDFHKVVNYLEKNY